MAAKCSEAPVASRVPSVRRGSSLPQGSASTLRSVALLPSLLPPTPGVAVTQPPLSHTTSSPWVQHTPTMEESLALLLEGPRPQAPHLNRWRQPVLSHWDHAPRSHPSALPLTPPSSGAPQAWLSVPGACPSHMAVLPLLHRGSKAPDCPQASWPASLHVLPVWQNFPSQAHHQATRVLTADPWWWGPLHCPHGSTATPGHGAQLRQPPAPTGPPRVWLCWAPSPPWPGLSKLSPPPEAPCSSRPTEATSHFSVRTTWYASPSDTKLVRTGPCEVPRVPVSGHTTVTQGNCSAQIHGCLSNTDFTDLSFT